MEGYGLIPDRSSTRTPQLVKPAAFLGTILGNNLARAPIIDTTYIVWLANFDSKKKKIVDRVIRQPRRISSGELSTSLAWEPTASRPSATPSCLIQYGVRTDGNTRLAHPAPFSLWCPMTCDRHGPKCSAMAVHGGTVVSRQELGQHGTNHSNADPR